MTKPDEVTVTDLEVDTFLRFQKIHYEEKGKGFEGAKEGTRQALAAFLAARVPDANEVNDRDSAYEASVKDGWNDCRAAVLRGLDQ